MRKGCFVRKAVEVIERETLPEKILLTLSEWSPNTADPVTRPADGIEFPP